MSVSLHKLQCQKGGVEREVYAPEKKVITCDTNTIRKSDQFILTPFLLGPPFFAGSPAFHQQFPHHLSPFTLCKIAGNISTCVGCHNEYVKAPDDMCIKHQEWREYTPRGSQTPKSRFGNVYYHFNPNCIWLRCSLLNWKYLLTFSLILDQVISPGWLFSILMFSFWSAQQIVTSKRYIRLLLIQNLIIYYNYYNDVKRFWLTWVKS